MTTSNWEKFTLLMWKNWKIQFNHKFELILEILVPAIFTLIILLFRVLKPAQYTDEATSYSDRSINLSFIRNQSVPQSGVPLINWELAYSPKNKLLKKILINAGKRLQLDVQSFKNSEKLHKYLLRSDSLAGIEFDDSLSNIHEYPTQMVYAIRFPGEIRFPDSIREGIEKIAKGDVNWMTNHLFDILSFGGLRNQFSDFGGPPEYQHEGFTAIQNAISLAFIEETAKSIELPDPDLPEIRMLRMPYPPYVFDPLLNILEGFVSLVIVFSFIYPTSQTVKYITVEKEMQLKEIMKIMGLPNWIHWSAWFVKTMILFCIAISITAIILKYEVLKDVAILVHTDMSVLLFFFYVYCVAATTFTFMIATFFSRAKIAPSASGLIWFLGYLPYLMTAEHYQSMTFTQKLMFCLFLNSGLGIAMRLMIGFESTKEGFHWYNLFTPNSADDSLSIGIIMCVMLVCAAFYMLVALYVEKLFPGPFGVPEKWNFPFTSRFWKKPKIQTVSFRDFELNRDPNAFEPSPSNKRVGISVQRLRKKFAGKVAVEGLSLNLYRDEITVLLGHNGAGKTTTISMLIGMIPPTSGTAVINGHDIQSSLKGARESLGICPQHNILFDDLTIQDHIVFYSRMKGLNSDEVEDEVFKLINLLQMDLKKNTLSKKLSGGMKRKLSVGCALSGGSKIVLLDEPSSGMDPAARRALWNLIQAEKKNRTILLTTHFMDEADVLGDRIAIMHGGKIKCHGTPFFLKKKFGSGYHLIFAKNPGCDSTAVTKLLQQFIPVVEIESESHNELSYQLPDNYAPQFEKMLSAIEQASRSLKLGGFGITVASMEDVFLKVGAETELNAVESTASFDYQDNISDSDEDIPIRPAERLLRTWKLLFNQWKAMLLKKFLHTKHNYLTFIIQILIPICFIGIAVLETSLFSKFDDLPNRNILIDDYISTVTVMKSIEKSNVNAFSLKCFEAYYDYTTSFGCNHVTQIISTNLTKYFIDVGAKSLFNLNTKYLQAITVSDKYIVAWFNNNPLHTVPLALNSVHNAIARTVLGRDYSIEIINKPLPFAARTKLDAINTGSPIGFLVPLNLNFCLSFVSSFCILFLINERSSRAKLLQFVSGVKVFMFWLGHFFTDLVLFLFIVLLFSISLAIFRPEGFQTFEELSHMFVILLFYSISILPLMYLFSTIFKEPATGFLTVSTFNVFTGLMLFYVVSILNMLNFVDEAHNCNLVFLIFPHYALTSALNNLNLIAVTRKTCETMCEIKNIQNCTIMDLCQTTAEECCVTDYYTMEEPGLMRNIIYFILVAVLLWILLLIKEYRLIQYICYKINLIFAHTRVLNINSGLDDDVVAEKDRIINLSKRELQDENLVLRGVTKYYNKFLAVKDLYVGIKPFECFGLLGVNGAGKTTVFKMMTGDEKITYGDAFVRGLNLKDHKNRVYRRIGYCPQYDGLLEDLTGREILLIFCLLRGIPKTRIKGITTEMAHSFGYTKHLDNPAKTYSGGNKRKLSTSLAMIGNPNIIFLDEPTSGMDPGSRRKLWNVVKSVRDRGKSIILTSHSMEECEALCTRIAIMVKGEFKCIGSTQHLKNKFSKGVVIRIKSKRNEVPSSAGMKSPPVLVKDRSNKESRYSVVNIEDTELGYNTQSIVEFITKLFPKAVLKERYQGVLTFYIPSPNMKWSAIFGLMEASKSELNIEDYSISQTTLEQIFLEFAQSQHDDERAHQ